VISYCFSFLYSVKLKSVMWIKKLKRAIRVIIPLSYISPKTIYIVIFQR